MNWYKIAQYYDEIKREDYLEYEDPDDIFSASQYFSIGQNQETHDQSYCWIWINNRLYCELLQTKATEFPTSLN